MDATIYKLLLWVLPVLLGLLSFIGALAVKSLMKMSEDINDIKVSLKEVSTKHENLEERIERIEDKIFA